MAPYETERPLPGELRIKKRTVWIMASVFVGLVLLWGFAIVVWIVARSTEESAPSTKPSTDISSRTWFKRFTPEAKLVVVSTNAKRSADNLVVLGEVRNDGNDSWKQVEVQVHLFGKGDSLVGLCRNWIYASVRPGMKRYFSVDCDGTKDKPVADYDRYAVEIADANYESE